ncbi:MAG: hypothetical protein KAG34_00595 [Cocleimonas sp.]|nr:hypothetical protein [Cocleimonas sp.]
MLIIGLNLSACSRPDATPPSVEPTLLSYLNTLEKGELKALDQLYFMPLHWRHQQKIYKQFNQQHELLKQKKLIFKMMSFKQKGRWALSAIEHNQSGKIQIKPVWFFYYENRWQFVSPIIFKTGPVRSMMNLHREQNDLRAWYANEQKNRRKPAK